MEYYKVLEIGGETIDNIKIVRYRFKNSFNDMYIVEVFHYDYNIYAIKFFLKKHKLSKKRYNLTYERIPGEKDYAITGNRNFLKVLSAILEITISITKKDKKASFGFLGAPRLSEFDPKKNLENINDDNTVANTKRYRIYHLYARRYFNPKDFEYIDSKSSSILLLRNNKNKDVLSIEVAENYINNDILPSL